MFRIRLFCTISIFLCALYSGRAQDWESRAVELERIIYDGAGLEETNEALLGKAECYKQLGRYQDAVATLARVRKAMRIDYFDDRSIVKEWKKLLG